MTTGLTPPPAPARARPLPMVGQKVSQKNIPVWLAIVAVSLPMFMATLDNLVMTSALPIIRVRLDAGIDELEWFVNAYSLCFATFMLMAAALGDRFGRRTIFVAGIAIFTIASTLSALSTQPWQLIATRALQGVGASALLPLSLTLLVGSVPRARRALAIGVWGGISGLGIALGPLIGGAVLQGWDWQAIFWINVPVGILAIPLVLAALPNSRGARVKADVLGVLLVGLGVLGVVYGLVRGNAAGWSSVEVLGALVSGAVVLMIFVLWQRRAAEPLLPLRLFRDRSFSVANAVGISFSFGIYGSIFILIQFLQIVQGKTPLAAGVETMPWTLAPMVIAPLAGLYGSRVGVRNLLMVGLALESIAMFWLAAELKPDVQYSALVGPFLCAGIGMGLIFAPSTTALLTNITELDRAKASGTYATLREIGVALGIAVLTSVFTGAGGQLTPTGYVHAAIPAITVGAFVLLGSALLAALLPSRRAAAGLAGRRGPLI